MTAPQTSPGEVPPAAASDGKRSPSIRDGVVVRGSGPRPATPTRCDFSDLPTDQCGCAHCRPDLVEKPFVPVQVEGMWTPATYPGTCGCGCWTKYAGGQGVEIVLAELEDGHTAWCLVEHTRRADAGLRDGC